MNISVNIFWHYLKKYVLSDRMTIAEDDMGSREHEVRSDPS